MATGKPQGTRKPRSKKALPPPRKLLNLSAAQEEALAAITLMAIALLTALGAFNLSGGNILDGWTGVLGALFGWGRYLAPFFFGGLGIWLLLDSLDLRPDIGGARPLGLAVLFVIFLTVLHLTPEGARGLQAASRGQGGGIIGYFISDLMVGAIGVLGTALILLIAAFIGVVLLFQVSPKQMLKAGIDGFRWLEAGWINAFNSVANRRPALPRGDHEAPALTSGPAQPSARAARIPARRAEPGDQAPPVATVSPRPAVAAKIVGGGEARAPIHREWRLPRIEDILVESVENELSQTEIRDKVRKIEDTLKHFGVPARVTEVSVGPTITQFGVEPGFLKQKAPDGSIRETKVKVSRISALQHDLELALATAPVRVEAPVPGKSIVGIEVPNSEKSNVSLRGVMESEEFKKANKKSNLAIALGQDVSGQAIVGDLSSMPHLLIAGATGSGKSVCINALIACLLLTNTPDDVQFVMVDPKRVELSTFRGLPHLLTDVVVEMDLAVAALQRAVVEMDARFKMFAKVGARNLETYNQLAPEKRREAGMPEAKLPYLILIVDELADLMMVSADEVEKAITRLAQMARATGIHLVLATQRPSVDVVTGLIKANFPSRISFAVTSQIDSRVVLDTPGAEKLLGRGDMLYMASDSSKLSRLQGGFVSDQELEKLTTYWKGFVEEPPPSSPTIGVVGSPSDLPRAQVSPASIITSVPADPGNWVQGGFLWNLESRQAKSEEDELLDQAIQIIQASNRASISLLQRKLRIGYSRAARLMDLLKEKGYVDADADGTAPYESSPFPGSRSEGVPPGIERNFVDADEDSEDESSPATLRAAKSRPESAPAEDEAAGDTDEQAVPGTVRKRANGARGRRSGNANPRAAAPTPPEPPARDDDFDDWTEEDWKDLDRD